MSAGSQEPPPLWRIEVGPRQAGWDAHGHAVLHDIHELGMTHVSAVCSSRLFLLEGPLAPADTERICAELLADPVTERYSCRPGGDDPSLPGEGFDAAIEVRLRGGVMDPVAASTVQAIGDMGLPAAALAGATGRLYRLRGVRSIGEVESIARRLLYNDCIEEVYLSGFGRHDCRPDHLPVAPRREFQLRHIPLRGLDDEALRRLSRDAHLFLSPEEMRAIQDYYLRLGRDPTDLELEMLAQTWSEHCVHKTLRSPVEYRGAPMPPDTSARQQPLPDGQVVIRYDNLLKETIAAATHQLIGDGRVDWCLSVFADNAGVIGFDERHGVAFKVETHNHPSAIEPYGGAATGVGGVIRDVLGCGLGARPVANTDVFCFAPPDFPMDLLPRGVLHPRRVFRGVVAGVRDYGNRMGIPTINGSVHFDDRYLGNPLVFCGCVGLIPRDRISKSPRPGDHIVVIGGRTGRDGIHGATFSSSELTDTHADEFSHAVQIGDAITEKKVLDALIRARDCISGCLYTAVTDCGAGGLSSAIGEMAAELGAEVDLDLVPLKYAGLRYDEIWISEAQERMVLAVPPANWPALEAICNGEGVEATVIGSFRQDGRLIVRYRGVVVGDLEMGFVHEGMPRSRRFAAWTPPRPGDSGGKKLCTGGPRTVPLSSSSGSPAVLEQLLQRLSRYGNASKEWVIRQYDHEVQGASVIKPLVGPGQGPSDAAVIRPVLDSCRGLALANGMNTALADDDPYWMAAAGIDEALRNLVCVGGDPARTAILDNFCWGNCEDPQVMGALVRACQGCHDAALAYGTPFISGKDSLNNEFALDPADAERLASRIPLYNRRIRIPHTLLISAISVIEDVGRCLTMDAKPPGLADSCFVFVGLGCPSWPEVRLSEAAGLHLGVADLIRRGWVVAAHDVGEDGVLLSLAEMAFAGLTGVNVHPVDLRPHAGVTSGYVLQVRRECADRARALTAALPGVRWIPLGEPRRDTLFSFHGDHEHFEIDVTALAEAWRRPLRW